MTDRGAMSQEEFAVLLQAAVNDIQEIRLKARDRKRNNEKLSSRVTIEIGEEESLYLQMSLAIYKNFVGLEEEQALPEFLKTGVVLIVCQFKKLLKELTESGADFGVNLDALFSLDEALPSGIIERHIIN